MDRKAEPGTATGGEVGMSQPMKGITCCADCAYYNMKKHHCTRASDEGKPTAHFYADCPLPTVTPEPGWISVKERLPDIYEPFYAACKSLVDDRENWTIEGIYKGSTFGGPWGVPMVECGKAEVYAWMPKIPPEPPKEDKQSRF